MLIFSLITVSALNAQYLNNKRHDNYEKLPEFSYNTLDGKKFSNTDLKPNERLMSVYFNPLCELCQDETSQILENINYFQDIQIVMVTPGAKEEVLKFVSKFKLNKYHQITVLHDKEDTFYKKFDAMGYPTMYLYDTNNKMISKFETEVEFDEIRDAFGTNVAKK